MKYVPRLLGRHIEKAARHFPAVILTGLRRAGKTTLLRRLLPRASYWLAEDPDVIARIRSDPRGFLMELKPPVILDEIQHVPEILAYLCTRIDAAPHKMGQWFLTGSQEAPLMRGVSESLAGRAAVFQLWPLGLLESPKVSLLKGGFPEVLARPAQAFTWFSSYVQTYLERDVRAVSEIRDLATFRRFLALVASRSGQILNKTDLAAPLGVTVPTLTAWLNILELTCQIILVPPFFENFGKRLVKSPKLYVADAGLACHLLAIDSEKTLQQSPFLGAIFEGFVAAEIIKQQTASGRRRELYYFRDQQGLEVDFVIPAGHRRLLLVEAKAAHTAQPRMAEPLLRLKTSITGYQTNSLVVYRRTPSEPKLTVLRPGVHVGDVTDLLGHL
jgi:predicted AAA+ superfamily ATPase